MRTKDYMRTLEWPRTLLPSSGSLETSPSILRWNDLPHDKPSTSVDIGQNASGGIHTLRPIVPLLAQNTICTYVEPNMLQFREPVLDENLVQLVQLEPLFVRDRSGSVQVPELDGDVAERGRGTFEDVSYRRSECLLGRDLRLAGTEVDRDRDSFQGCASLDVELHPCV